MSKTKISEYSSTSAGANLNTDIASINIDEGCAPSGINNAIRTLMAQIKDLQSGVSGDTIPVTAGGTGSTTASGARSALSAAASGANSDITSLTGLTTALSVAQGGTGATTLTGLVKGSGTSAFTAATAGTDYVSPSVATTFTKQQVGGNVALTDASSISWDVSAAQVATVTLGGNRTMSAPSNLVNGGFYALGVIQDSTGSRTLTWNSVFKWTGGASPTLSTAASSYDFFVFRSDGTNLYEQGRSLNVS